MAQRSVAHATFFLERTYRASPARTFAAFTTLEAKLAWSACHTGQEITEFDFRPGGREVTEIAAAGDQPPMRVEFRYHDIVAGERIVFSYAMEVAGVRQSVSLTTVEFEAAAGGTRLKWTEQGAYLDGNDVSAMIQEGTGEGLERLGETLNELAEA